MDLDQDWRALLEKSGCLYLKYVKKIRGEIVKDETGFWQAVVIYIEKEYSTCTLRMKKEVDIESLKIINSPESELCGEIKRCISAMDKAAHGNETGSENNRPA